LIFYCKSCPHLLEVLLHPMECIEMKPNNKLIEFVLNVDLNEFVDIVSRDMALQFELIKLQDRLHIGSNTHDSSIIEGLNKLELKKMIQVFTMMDQVKTRGSVSCVSQLLNSYKLLPDTNEADFNEILDWVLKTNDDRNPWLATGGAIFGVRSFDELIHFTSYNSANKIAKNISFENLVSSQKQDKRERLKLKANQDIWNAIRRKDKKAIEVLMSRGADLEQTNDSGESVRMLLENTIGMTSFDISALIKD
jgi:hypothetical protein